MKTLNRAFLAAALACFAYPAFAADLSVTKATCVVAMKLLMDKPYRVTGVSHVDGRQVLQMQSPNPAYMTLCYLDGNRVMWRTEKSPSHTSPGRWRNDPLDEVLTWSLTDKNLRVVMTFSDKSSTEKITKIR